MAPPASDHIVSAFDKDLHQLKETLLRMGGLVEAALRKAVEALAERNSDLAARVIEADEKIDAMENQVSEQVVSMIALRQPMASDLREIVSALKISADLERIGDYAKNVAKRSIALNQLPPMKPANAIPRMARLAQINIKRVLDAYIAGDSNAALAVWESDEELDETYNSLFRETLTYMFEDPRNITPCTHIMFIAKNIERIGDHATNIAETLYYQVEGTPLAQSRPKSDSTSFETLEE